MMKPRAVVLAVPLLLVLAGPVAGQTCDEPFDCPDGSSPAGLVSTGDPADEGGFEVQGGALEHIGEGSAHYVYKGCPYDVDVIEFDVRGAPWHFAWEITSGDSLEGTCQRLFHDEQTWGWGYVHGTYRWSVPDDPACPDCSFTWHHSEPAFTGGTSSDGPATGWHHVRIEKDILGRVSVYQVFLDGELLLTSSYDLPETGARFQGFGCPAVSGADPAFDNLVVEQAVPVQRFSWGAVKALYRAAEESD